MAAEATVSFKVYLVDEQAGQNNRTEVRRFGIDRDVVSSFTYLKEKLLTVFPTIQNTFFHIFWIDGDNDRVMISTDDELLIALAEMGGDVCKLYVRVMDPPHSRSPSPPQNGSNQMPHYGVTCDGCHGAIEGFRYKCIQCPDYDLCSACESAGYHPEHNMIRLPEPVFVRGNRFGPHLRGFLSRRLRPMDCDMGVTADDEQVHGCTRRKSHHHGHSDHGRKKRRSVETAEGGPSDCRKPRCARFPYGLIDETTKFLESYYKDLIAGHHSGSVGGAATDGQPAAGTAGTAGTGAAPHETTHIDYLKSVGRTVAQLLDPLGIDVDVSVRPKESEKTVPAEAGTGGDKPGNKTNEAAASPGVAAATAAAKITTDQLRERIQQLTESLAKQKMTEDREGWTLLNDESAAAAAAAQATATSDLNQPGPSVVPQNPQQTRSVYPQLPPFVMPPDHVHGGLMDPQVTLIPTIIPMPPPNAPHIPPPMAPHIPPPMTPHTSPAQPIPAPPTSRHPNVLVAQALETMTAMGFSDEGGWLTQLLESKNGDIYKVLDIMQPVPKSGQ